MAESGNASPFQPPRRVVKAYQNAQFLSSADARVIRILAEYLEPLQRFRRMNVRETIVFFGSSRARPPVAVRGELEAAQQEKRKCPGRVPADLQRRLERLQRDLQLSLYYEDAEELAALLTRWARSLDQGHRFVICSGGGPGIMEAANRGAAERARGLTVGLTISLPTEERPNPFVTPELLFEFHYFFMRKLWFVYLACAMVIFPGGFGTMDELFELLTLVQTRKVDRPIPIVLYGRKFWREFIDFEALVRWGTVGPGDIRLFRMCDSPREAFEFLRRELLRHYPRPVQWGRP